LDNHDLFLQMQCKPTAQLDINNLTSDIDSWYTIVLWVV